MAGGADLELFQPATTGWRPHMNTLYRLLASIAVVLAAALPLRATAGDAPWPSRPVQILVPGGAGGVTDIRARWLAQRLAALLGQSVIVENKPGAGGNLGMELAARSAPDGYTLVSFTKVS